MAAEALALEGVWWRWCSGGSMVEATGGGGHGIGGGTAEAALWRPTVAEAMALEAAQQRQWLR